MAKDMYQKRRERKEAKVNNGESLHKTSINWYPGHMAKTKRLIKENLNLIDIIYEVIDSRIPYSSKIKDLDSLIKNKPRILIMTKYDLCDKSETDKFIDYYKNLGYSVLTYDLINDNNIKDLSNLSKKILEVKFNKMENSGVNRNTIRALVVGIPNVGKSTLINKIIGKKSAEVGNKPGVTKEVRWIKGDNDILLLDSPGILWPKLEQGKVALNLASLTAIKEEILEKQDVVLYIIDTLYKYYPDRLKELYNISSKLDLLEILDIIGRKKGYLLRGGIVDDEKVINSVLNDIKSGKIKNITFDRIEDVK